MKKFYSLVLMAAALLIGTNAWAVNVSTRDQLQQAIDNTPLGGSVDITLTADVKIGTSNPINIYAKKAESGKNVTINLNGKTIASDGNTTPAALIKLFKGTLNLVGPGSMTSKGETVIKVFGNEDPSEANWTVLTIGQGVEISGDDEGVGIYAFQGKTYKYAYHSNEETVYDYDGKIYDGTTGVHYYNEATEYANIKYGSDSNDGEPLVTSGAIDYVTGFPAYYKWSDGGYGCYGSTASAKKYTSFYEKGKAFGANVIINGKVYGKKYGMKINGTIKYPRVNESDNLPYVHITPTGEVQCASDGKTAVYSSGCGKWLIEGYVHGCIGVFVKAGELVINDAVIESDNTRGGSYTSSSGNTTSGIDGGYGSAIVVESNNNYLGGHDVTISGDTKVTGANGYAVEEVVKAGDNSKVTSIDIEGGTFVEGANGQGSMAFTDKTTSEGKVTVYGATVEGELYIDGDEKDLETITPPGTHVVEVTNADGSKTLVVSEGDAPEADETGTWSKITTNAAAHPSDTVNAVWTELDQTAEITTHMILGELHMTSAGAGHKQTIHVNDGAILDVRRVILNDRAEIVVEAGGKVIVYGEQGIVAPVVSNIVLKNEGAVTLAERKHAIFLFNPAVTSNRHPNATVEMTTYSFVNSGSDYQWERFGVPTWNALKSVTSTAAVATRFQVYEGTGWKELGFLDSVGKPNVQAADLKTPFATYNLLAYRKSTATPVPTYKFAGELVGNMDAALNVTNYWTGFTNSYSANLNIPALFAAVKAGTIIDEFIYVAIPQGNGSYTWDPVDEYVGGFSSMKLSPMQAFILKKTAGSTATESVAMNYKNMVYNPATGASLAPRRRVASDEFTARVRVVVENENGVWDNVKLRETATLTKEAEKYMNNDINIYAMGIEKAAIFAVEDLNNSYLGFSTVSGGKFTISFADVMGTEYTLIDHETGARVAMVEGNIYEFTAAANSVNDYRFEIVATAKIPTAIDNTEAVKSVKGIYTITGQYVGEMNVWNTLPAGVYVVNGEKRVK